MHTLAYLYTTQGKYEEAKGLYEKAFTILLQTFGMVCTTLPLSLFPSITKQLILTLIFVTLGSSADGSESQQLYVQLTLHQLSNSLVLTVWSIMDAAAVAWIHFKQAQYGKAEELYSQSLAIREKTFGKV